VNTPTNICMKTPTNTLRKALRLNRIAVALLVLLAGSVGTAQLASAMTLPMPDAGGPTLPSVAPVASRTLVVHDHVSLWAYLLIAVLAVAATLVVVAVVAVVRPLRRALTGRGTFDPALQTSS
jgi:hypothetical protein